MGLIILVFIAMTAIHSVGDFLLKRSSVSFTWTDFLLASLLYVMTTPGYLWLMKSIKLATLGSIGSAVGIVALVSMGTLVFHERLDTREIFGVVLAVIAVAMFYK